MFRHRQVGGRTEYTMEDYQGNVLTELSNPVIGFEIWTIRQIESLLHEYGIVGATENPKAVMERATRMYDEVDEEVDLLHTAIGTRRK